MSKSMQADFGQSCISANIIYLFPHGSKELGGESFTAYDANGNAVDISIAEPDKRFKNKNGKTTPVNKDLSTKYIGNEVKQESITLIDELIATAEYKNQLAPNYSHGWLDGNGQNNWEYWKTYVQDKTGDIWQATLNVANTSSGEKILYDVNPIKKVGQSVKSDTSLPVTGQSVKSDTSTVNNSISNSGENVNTKFSLSPEGEGRAQYGDYNVYGEDITTPDWNDIAPPVETAQSAQTAVGDDITPTMEEIAKMDEQRAAQQEKTAEAPKAANEKVQKKFDRIDSVVEVDKKALVAERDQKLKNLGTKPEYIGKRAGELFDEIYYYRELVENG